MTKNKLEKLFSESMHSDKELWAMKLHNNPLAHQNTPADYILDYQTKTPIYPDEIEPFKQSLRLMLIECKQVTLDEDKGRLAFKRLKQMHDLINFENIRPNYHKSYFCIGYWSGFWSTSEIYIVPVYTMQRLVMTFAERGIVSLNREQAKEHLKNYRAELKNGLINFVIVKS